MNIEEDIKKIHLSDYFKIIVKRKSLIIIVLLISVSFALVQNYLAKPVYQATAKLVIDKEQTFSPITGERLNSYGGYMSESIIFNTHLKLIKSTPVLIELVKALKLDERKQEVTVSTYSRLKKQLKTNIKLILGKEQKEQQRQEVRSGDEKIEMLARGIGGAIVIMPVMDTHILTITARNTDPVLASEIANTLAKKYIEFDISSRLSSSKDNLEWMNKEMYSLKKRLEDDEAKFQEYKQLNKIFSVQGKQKVIDQKIQEFNTEYLEARNKRLELDAQLEQIRKLTSSGGSITHIRSLVNNSSIDTIYENITKLELERTRLSKVFKMKHPKMVQNAGEITRNKSKLKNELQKEVDNLESERSILEVKEKVMAANISQFEEDAVAVGGKELRYSMLQRNMITSQNLYDSFLTKVKNSGVTSNSESSNIRIVERSLVPRGAVSPNKKKNLLISIMFGLLGGIGMAFFLEYLDQSVRTEEDVQEYLNLPVLASIPVADLTDTKGAY